MGKKAAKKPEKIKKVAKKTPEPKAEPVKKSKEAVIEIMPDQSMPETTPVMNEIPVSPFKDPSDLTVGELQTHMQELVKKDTDAEVELSAYIGTFWEKNEHEKMGYEWNEYFRNVIGIAPFKANALRDNWLHLKNLVELPKAIIGLAWSKIRAVIPAIKTGHITKKNIKDWLEHCTIGGPKSLSCHTIESMIKQLIGKAAKEAMDTELKTISFKVPAYEIDSFNQFIEIAKAVLKTDNLGSCFLTAALEFSANHAHATDAQVWRARGLASLKETAERIAPVVALFVPTDPAATQEILGVQPFTQVFQGFGDPNGSGDRSLIYCIASKEKEAMQFMGVKEVRVCPIKIAPSFQPKIPFSMAAPAATPAEPEKTKKGPKAKSAEKTTESVKEAKKEDFTEQQKTIKGLPAEKVKAAIKGLIDEMNFDQADFVKHQDEVRKNPVPGLTVTQVMLDWLMNMKGPAK